MKYTKFASFSTIVAAVFLPTLVFLRILVYSMVFCLGMNTFIQAAPINPSNFLVTEANYLFEYTRAGAFVQRFIIPHPESPSNHDANGIVVRPNGNVMVRNSSVLSTQYFSELNPGTGVWSHIPATGLQHGNASDGDLSARGEIAFSNARRLDMQTQQITSFTIPGRSVGEVSWGLDGLLYALDGGSPRPGVRVLDPGNLSIIRELVLHDNAGANLVAARGISVTNTGELFVAASDGFLYEYTSNGILLNSIQTGLSGIVDIDLHPDGSILVGGHPGKVALTDTTLSAIQIINVGFGADFTYVSFATAVPEPSTWVLACALFGGVIITARRKMSGCFRRTSSKKLDN